MTGVADLKNGFEKKDNGMSQVPSNALAPWWRGTGSSKAKGDVVAHTADPTKYHSPDSSQQSRMGLGAKGIMGTMIARARADGSSMGFDHNKAGVVHVDPDAPGGGILLDPSRMTNEATRHMLAQVDGQVGFGRQTDDATFAVVAALGATLAEAAEQGYDPPVPAIPSNVSNPQPEPVGNPHLPNAYVAPRADGNGVQHQHQHQHERMVKQAAPVLDDDQPAPARRRIDPPQQQTQPEPVYVQPMQEHPANTVAPANANQQSVAMQALMQQMLQMMQSGVVQPPPTQQVATAPSQVMPPIPPVRRLVAPPTPEVPAEPQAEYEDYDRVIESLAMPFVTGHKPLKPTVQAIFELGKAGNMSAKFHDVIEGAGCLVLVYDTRYEDGSQWLPPDFGRETIKLSLTKSKKKYEVLSLGYTFTIGCLDCVVLIVPEAGGDPAAAEHGEDA